MGDIKLKISVMCQGCGSGLEAEYYPETYTISVVPCQECVEEITLTHQEN